MRFRTVIGISLCVLLLMVFCGCSRRPSTITGAKRSKGAMIQIKGSDTMVNLGQAWAEQYMKVHRDANVAVTGGGSGTGIAALLNGTTDIAESSRPMEKPEIAIAREHGIDPVENKVALDALSVIVNPGNPVSKLTVDQLSDVFVGKVTNWKQIGGTDAPIVLLSRDKNSGSHVFFLEHIVRKGNSKGTEEYAKTALMLPSSEAIASQVATDKNAIGYVGLGYVNPKKQKALAVAKIPAGPFVKPSIETAIAGTYPIARPLYWYTNGRPAGIVKNLLDFVLSPEGQKIVDQLGFAPIRKG